jgi:hypothetical protein
MKAAETGRTILINVQARNFQILILSSAPIYWADCPFHKQKIGERADGALESRAFALRQSRASSGIDFAEMPRNGAVKARDPALSARVQPAPRDVSIR